ncbi:MAG TPA: hypothetical protein VHQ86_00570 [Candidatus Saccharimonadia bacterium]|nr:hypothetical protein [Candidatus Saccharimonadia bacterium]
MLVGIAALNYQTLLDDYTLSVYQPSAKVSAFESRVTLTRHAQAVFGRANPVFDDKQTFNRDCDTQPHELELGCYYRGRIYVLQVDNASLAPEMDVVAAHELLHAVWEGMSPSDRQVIGKELERVYAGITDQDLKDRMAGYAQSEPGEQDNELHSILGTEYATTSPLLEAHYTKYFANRPQVVAEHAAYKAVFESRRTELESELASIRSEKAQLSLINRQLDSLRASGQIAAYNALVPKQNQLVDDINSRIEKYQSGVDEYNALSKSLDSQEITDTEPAAQ